MLIGIIGYGVVGQAIGHSFKMQGHRIAHYDKYLNESTTISELTAADCIFVCVPTNNVNNTCDTSIVKSTVETLAELNYTGIIIIKSTVVPGTTQKLIDQYPDLKLSFVPEFLRQDNASDDFQNLTKTLIVGTTRDDDFKFISNLHRPFSPDAINITPTEAEIVKYFSNNYNSMRVVFANAYYEVCKKIGASYNNILSAAVTLPNIQSDLYLKCSPGQRGYEGKCLPKDTQAFNSFLKELNLPIELFNAIINDNEHYTKK